MTKNKTLIIIGLIAGSLIISAILITSLNSSKPKSAAIEPTEPTTESTTQSINVTPDPIETTEAPTEPDQIVLGEGEMLNPLTGMPMGDVTEDNRRPIAVMLDNLYPARPQAGLKDADICYEILAEGRITRYMAVFYATYPILIGPVRSARPYFVEKALELDGYYVHVGGSNQALLDIRKNDMADIDGLSSGAFWRKNHKRIPHNMYTSSEAILNDASRKGYRNLVIPEFNPFYTQYTPITGTQANEIKFVYKEPTQSDSIGYYTSYKYNNETRLYSRYTNGKPHVDETDETHLTCTNIIVQYAKTKVIDSEGRLQIDLIGSGNGRFYSNGHMVDIKWEKISKSSPTEFFNLDGSVLYLNPGRTWIQVFEEGRTEEILN